MAQSPKLKIRMMATNDLQKEVVFNEALIVLDAMVARSALSRTNTPPPAPTDGMIYIVSTAPTAAWSGFPNNIAMYYNGWRFYAPTQKMRFFNEATSSFWTYSGSGWTADAVAAPTNLGDLANVGGSAPADGDVLTYRIADNLWVPMAPKTAPDLGDLADVVISSPAVNQVLGYDLTTNTWKNVTIQTGGGGGVTKFAELEDVSTSNQSNKTYLGYDEALQKYVFKILPNLDQIELNDLLDVFAAHVNLQPNDALVWNGAAWGPSSKTFNYSFIGMVDGPQTFEGFANHFLVVDNTESKMVFKSLGELISVSNFRLQDLSDVAKPVAADVDKVLVVKATNGNFRYEYLTLPTWAIAVSSGATELTNRLRSITFNNLDVMMGTAGHIVVTADKPLIWQGEGIPLTGDKPFAVNFKGQGVGVTNVAGVVTVTIDGGAGSVDLAGLTDVDLTTPPTNKQALIFNAVTQKWVAGEGAGSLPAIDGMAEAALYELGPFAPPAPAFFPILHNGAGSDLAVIKNRGLVYTPGPQTVTGARHVARVRTVTNNLAPWTVTARVKPSSFAVAGHAAGICLQRQQNSRLVFLNVGNSNTDTQAVVRFGYTNDAGAETITLSRPNTYEWLRLNFDGNDIRAFVSADGVLWQLFGTISATTALAGTPNRVGLEQRSNAVHNGQVGAIYTYYDDPDFSAANVKQQGVVSLELGGVSDVDLTTVAPVTGDGLVYDAEDKTWKPKAGGGGGGTALPPYTGNKNKHLAVNVAETGLVWVDPESGGGGAAKLDDLTDVDIVDPQAGQALLFDAVTQTFVNRTLDVPAANLTINAKTANYTLVAVDAGAYVRMNSSSPTNLTVPANAQVAFPIGTQIHVRQAGVGTVTLAGSVGVTLSTPETLRLRKRGSSVTLVKVATDAWDVTGDLEVIV